MTISVAIGDDFVDFPDGTDPEVIRQAMVAKYGGPEAPDERGAVEKAADVMADTGSTISQSAQEAATNISNELTQGMENYSTKTLGEGTENPVSAAANMAEPILKSVGEVAKVGMDTWMATYGKIPVVANAIEQIGSSRMVKKGMEMAQQGIAAWDTWAEANPTEAAAVVDMGVLAEVGLPKMKSPLGPYAQKLKVKGNTQSIDVRREGIKKMVTPETRVGDGMTDEVGRGPLRRTTYEPSPQEDTIIKTMETIDDIDPNRSFAYNIGKTDAALDDLRGKTEKILRSQHRNKIDTSDIIEELEVSLEDIRDIPGYHALRGDAENIAKDYLVEATRILKESKKTPMGLLEARRAFDKVVNEGGDVFSPDVLTAKKVAARHIRDTMNQKLLRSIGAKEGDEIYDLLNRQHNLLSGKDILKSRKAAEGNSAYERLWQTAKDTGHLPTTVLGLMATGSFAMGSPMLAGVAGAGATGYAGFRMFQGLKGPKIKQHLAKVLAATDKTIKATTDDAVLGQLKADRVTLVELIKSSNEELEAMAETEE